jgi:hypothetical protein
LPGILEKDAKYVRTATSLRYKRTSLGGALQEKKRLMMGLATAQGAERIEGGALQKERKGTK